MKYIFFINPTAGKGNTQDGVIQSIKEYFSKNGGAYELYVTEFKGDAEKRARELAESGEELMMFACGGEGTGYEVINGIVGFENVRFGVIPCGSANDFLKYFGSKEAFLDIGAQVSGETVCIDLIKAGERYCINSCSVGMDAMVARDMSMFKNLPFVSGPFSYKLAILKNFLSKLGVKIKITVDGVEKGTIRCLFAVIANAPFYGGDYMAAPFAVFNDGLLDFTMVRVISRIRVLRFLSRYKKGDIADLKYCSLEKCKSMSFESERAVPVNFDGEIYEAQKMDFSIVENALKFVVPSGVKMPKNEKIRDIVNKN